MDLDIGTKLGHFEIMGCLGVGGMGQVYRAKDAKLGRDVAIKVLPDVFALDANRLARFEREARLLASLNHPNIATIHDYVYDPERALHFLVMELIEGETLADRIHRGAVGVDEALPIFARIAEALEAAHERGVIHRDLKPGNIKVSNDGAVKVLDFGLGKAMDTHPDRISHDSPTRSALSDWFEKPQDWVKVSHEGLVLGTPAYMSPEQARGEPVDKRTDIWAFGCCFYEALTGKLPFDGSSDAELIANIIKSEPDFDALPRKVPGRVRILIWRCLQKEARRRLRDIGEARFEIVESSSDGLGTVPVLGRTAARPSSSRRGLVVGMLAGLIAGAAIATGFLVNSDPGRAPLPLRKLHIPLPDIEPGDEVGTPSISPDGSMLAFNKGGRLWIQELNQLEARPVPGTDGAVQPFWSPDSEWLGFGAKFKLWKVRVSGGAPVPLADLETETMGFASGGAWTEDGNIVFTDGHSPLFQVSALGGQVTIALEPQDGETDFHEANRLPHGKGVLATAHGGRHGWPIVVLSKQGRKTVHAVEGERLHDPVYSPSGHILYQVLFQGRVPLGIWAVPFSLNRLETTGEPFLIAPGGANPSVSSDGTLVYVTGVNVGQRQLAWVNRKAERIEVVGEPHEGMWTPSLSPDGRRVAVSVGRGGDANITVIDLDSGQDLKLSSSKDPELGAAWSKQGDFIAYTRVVSGTETIYLQSADGRGEARKIVQGSDAEFSADGDYLVFNRDAERTGRDLWTVDLNPGSEPKPLLQTPGDEFNAKVSSEDGHIAYLSDESGDLQVWLMPGGLPDDRRQLTVDGAVQFIQWSPSGATLYFSSGNSDIMEIDVATSPAFSSKTPKNFFEESQFVRPSIYGFAAGSDPDRLLIVTRLDRKKDEASIVVVQNWFAEFEEPN